VVAPINAILNYLLGIKASLLDVKRSSLTLALVWGPEPIALGFIGAPLATAISFNLISIASIIYGIFFVPNTAWHPFSRRSFTSLGVLVRLGMGGVGQFYRTIIDHLPTLDNLCLRTGQTASEWWCWELIGRESFFSEGQNRLADKVVIHSRRQPVSHKCFGLHNLLMAKVKLASDRRL
jgi:MATE family multidrug resistance protein